MQKILRKVLIQPWFRFTRSMTLGVRIIAVRADGHICLVRHTYVQGWHLPGGGVERGENCLEAALKEAREEAGLLIAPSDMALISVHTNFDYFPGDHVLVYATRSWNQLTTTTAHEIAEYGFFDPLNLPEGTTSSTRRRLAEFAGGPVSTQW